MDMAVLGAWLEFAVRWAHVITAIAWVGSSFYFIALDLSLRKPDDAPPGIQGDEWQAHGGGFYHIRKYLVAPEHLPEHLTWFKWEAYFTWISGFALMAVVYYAGAESYLIDPNVADLPAWAAVAVSAGSLGFAWLIYNAVCKSALGSSNTRLMIILFAALTAMAWGYTQVFQGRAALLHLGAATATIMSANVFLIIIPNQAIIVADLKAGRKPDAKYGRSAKQRSTHNNYLVLPVLFLMLSNHYPLAFASEWNWLIATLVFLMGAVIRHFFNTMHGGGGKLWWTWGAAGAIFAVIIWLSMPPADVAESEDAVLGPVAQRFAAAKGFDDVTDIVLGRCSMCHSAQPGWGSLRWAPKGVVLETPEDIARHARAIYLQAGISHAMPPANVSYIEPEERARIVHWYRAAGRG